MVVGGQSVLSDSKEEGEGEREVKWRKKRGERKKYKIMICTTIVTVHIFTITVVIVHLCTILYPLMWVLFFFFFFFYLSKSAYLNIFSTLHYFAFTNASALTRLKSTISRVYQMPENNNLKLSSL